MNPPQAIQDNVQYATTPEFIHRLMAAGELTRGRADQGVDMAQGR